MDRHDLRGLAMMPSDVTLEYEPVMPPLSQIVGSEQALRPLL
jgi:hypothetical protein